jgi:hypothetical protein
LTQAPYSSFRFGHIISYNAHTGLIWRLNYCSDAQGEICDGETAQGLPQGSALVRTTFAYFYPIPKTVDA